MTTGGADRRSDEGKDEGSYFKTNKFGAKMKENSVWVQRVRRWNNHEKSIKAASSMITF